MSPIRPLRPIHIALVAAALCAAPHAPAADHPPGALAAWDFSQSTREGEGMRVDEGIIGNDLSIPNATGITIQDDPGKAGKKVISFDGSQQGALASAKEFDLDETVEVRFRMMPEVEGADWQAVVFFQCGFELRYFKTRKALGLIVRLDADNRVEVLTPITAGDWSEVVASVKGRLVSLTVNDHTETAEIPSASQAVPIKCRLTIGNAAGRPYSGLLADLVVLQPN